MSFQQEIVNQGELAYKGQLLLQESLAEYTTWRVGGAAKVLYKPAGVADLSVFLKQLPAE